MQTVKGNCSFHCKTLHIMLLLIFLMLGTGSLPQQAAAQEDDAPQERLQITGVDTSAFPRLGINFIATDAQSQPIGNLNELRLRENSVPIADFRIEQVTAGIDLIFVIDANERMLQVQDDGGLSRLQQVRDTILYYSGRFMDLAGRDHISVLVPGGERGQLLVKDITQPAALIDAVRGYNPENAASTAVVPMLEQALQLAADSKAEGRFQAIVLFTDGVQLNSFLFPPLLEEARALQVPLFALLLNTAANESAVANMSALTAPTRGFYVHMPSPSDSSELFQILQANATQPQLRYDTNLTKSGTYPIEITMSTFVDEIMFELAIASPEVTIDLSETTIRRTGVQPDTPLADLQPSIQPVPVTVAWPDNMPRQLDSVTLFANGEPQDAPVTGTDQALQFDWNISDLEPGTYQVTVQITDTLGLAAESEPVPISIEVARPQPLPTPSPTPTPSPFSYVRRLVPNVRPQLSAPGRAFGLVALVLVVTLLITRRLARTEEEPEEPITQQPTRQRRTVSKTTDTSSRVGALLELVEAGPEPLALIGTSITIGRDPQYAQLAIEDNSVSPLHARISWRGETYWLYDEGSELGTFLNYERLGLSPKPLTNGDEVQIGRLRLRFRRVHSEQGTVEPDEEE